MAKMYRLLALGLAIAAVSVGVVLVSYWTHRAIKDLSRPVVISMDPDFSPGTPVRIVPGSVALGSPGIASAGDITPLATDLSGTLRVTMEPCSYSATGCATPHHFRIIRMNPWDSGILDASSVQGLSCPSTEVCFVLYEETSK